MALDGDTLEEALVTLGEVLDSRHLRFEIVAIGGGALLLLGVLERPTKDLDVVAFMDGHELKPSEPFPPELREASRDVARALNLASDWLNSGPTSLLDFGLPRGFAGRAERRTYGPGLVVYVASRVDQIHFKFYATVDTGPTSKHFQDLKLLAPTHDELRAAARWAMTHDTSEPFRKLCSEVLNVFGVEASFDE